MWFSTFVCCISVYVSTDECMCRRGSWLIHFLSLPLFLSPYFTYMCLIFVWSWHNVMWIFICHRNNIVFFKFLLFRYICWFLFLHFIRSVSFSFNPGFILRYRFVSPFYRGLGKWVLKHDMHFNAFAEISFGWLKTIRQAWARVHIGQNSVDMYSIYSYLPKRMSLLNMNE